MEARIEQRVDQQSADNLYREITSSPKNEVLYNRLRGHILGEEDERMFRALQPRYLFVILRKSKDDETMDGIIHRFTEVTAPLAMFRSGKFGQKGLSLILGGHYTQGMAYGLVVPDHFVDWVKRHPSIEKAYDDKITRTEYRDLIKRVGPINAHLWKETVKEEMKKLEERL